MRQQFPPVEIGLLGEILADGNGHSASLMSRPAPRCTFRAPAVPGDEREESAFHEKFASCRVDLDGRPELFWIRGPVLAFLNQNAPGWRSKGRTSELSADECEKQIRQVVYHGAPAAKLAEAARYLAWQNLDNARDWAEGAAAHRDGALNGGWWYETAFNISTFDSEHIIRRLWRRDERERLASQWGYRRRWAAVCSAVMAAIAEAEST